MWVPFLASVGTWLTRAGGADYGQKEATEKKLLRDAFVKGDLWLRMGDLMRMESDGYLCESYRVGDVDEADVMRG
jgi:acyl-CoA synthetase (AMP-forming)/AMP-acid ligase II